MSRHTPGRWHTLPDSPTVVRSDALGPGYFSALLIASDREPNPVYGGGIPPAQAVANACLISAAPDMLAALERAIKDAVADDMDEWFAQCRTAIAKAKGE